MSRVGAVLTALAALVLTAPVAAAEVEPGGWESYSRGFNVQERGCGQVDDLTFRLTCTTVSGDQRAERRYVTYTGGSRQFEGYFRITDLPGSRISLKQTFNEATGPFFMLAVERGGRLYAVHGGDTIATGATIGTTVRVNTVHDVGGTHRTYINGSLRHRSTPPSRCRRRCWCGTRRTCRVGLGSSPASSRGLVGVGPGSVSAGARGGEGAPTELTATVVAPDEVRFEWTVNSVGEEGFLVESRPAGSGRSGWWPWSTRT